MPISNICIPLEKAECGCLWIGNMKVFSCDMEEITSLLPVAKPETVKATQQEQIGFYQLYFDAVENSSRYTKIKEALRD